MLDTIQMLLDKAADFFSVKEDDSPAYCAMEDGKSACKCWCMHVESDFKPMFYYCQCVCKECI